MNADMDLRTVPWFGQVRPWKILLVDPLSSNIVCVERRRRGEDKDHVRRASEAVSRPMQQRGGLDAQTSVLRAKRSIRLPTPNERFERVHEKGPFALSREVRQKRLPTRLHEINSRPVLTGKERRERKREREESCGNVV